MFGEVRANKKRVWCRQCSGIKILGGWKERRWNVMGLGSCSTAIIESTKTGD